MCMIHVPGCGVWLCGVVRVSLWDSGAPPCGGGRMAGNARSGSCPQLGPRAGIPPDGLRASRAIWESETHRERFERWARSQGIVFSVQSEVPTYMCFDTAKMISPHL